MAGTLRTTGGGRGLPAPSVGHPGQLGGLRWMPSLCPGTAIAWMVSARAVPSGTETARASPPQPVALSSKPPHGQAAPQHTGGSLLRSTSYSLKSGSAEQAPLRLCQWISVTQLPSPHSDSSRGAQSQTENTLPAPASRIWLLCPPCLHSCGHPSLPSPATCHPYSRSSKAKLPPLPRLNVHMPCDPGLCSQV